MKNQTYLIFGVVLLAIAHVAYTVESTHVPLEGNYFTSGIMLASDGQVVDYSIRLQADEGHLFYFGRYAGGVTQFAMRFTSGLLGSARLVTEGAVDTIPGETLLMLDRDILFNYGYHAKANSKLSLYRLDVGGGSSCFYIPELSAARCLGSERLRVGQ